MNLEQLYSTLRDELEQIVEAKTFKYEVPLESEQGGRVKVKRDDGRDVRQERGGRRRQAQVDRRRVWHPLRAQHGRARDRADGFQAVIVRGGSSTTIKADHDGSPIGIRRDPPRSFLMNAEPIHGLTDSIADWIDLEEHRPHSSREWIDKRMQDMEKSAAGQAQALAWPAGS